MMPKQLLRFGLVGGLATMVHLLIGTILIQSGLPPLTANAVAFAFAFFVSFAGHLGYSFADQEPGFGSSLWRFAIVSLTGFACNEILLAVLLYKTSVPGVPALIATTMVVVFFTFLLGKYWAFSTRAIRPDLR